MKSPIYYKNNLWGYRLSRSGQHGYASKDEAVIAYIAALRASDHRAEVLCRGKAIDRQIKLILGADFECGLV